VHIYSSAGTLLCLTSWITCHSWACFMWWHALHAVLAAVLYLLWVRLPAFEFSVLQGFYPSCWK